MLLLQQRPERHAWALTQRKPRPHVNVKTSPRSGRRSRHGRGRRCYARIRYEEKGEGEHAPKTHIGRGKVNRPESVVQRRAATTHHASTTTQTKCKRPPWVHKEGAEGRGNEVALTPRMSPALNAQYKRSSTSSQQTKHGYKKVKCYRTKRMQNHEGII